MERCNIRNVCRPRIVVIDEAHFHIRRNRLHRGGSDPAAARFRTRRDMLWPSGIGAKNSCRSQYADRQCAGRVDIPVRRRGHVSPSGRHTPSRALERRAIPGSRSCRRCWPPCRSASRARVPTSFFSASLSLLPVMRDVHRSTSGVRAYYSQRWFDGDNRAAMVRARTRPSWPSALQPVYWLAEHDPKLA